MDAFGLTEVLGGRWRGGYGSARCPAHDDAHPSLSVKDGAEGKLLVHCHAGCSQDDVVAALKDRELWPAAGWPELAVVPSSFGAAPSRNGSGEIRPEIIATYDYLDETGGLLFQAVRYSDKTFRGRRRNGAGWVYRLDDARRVLYRMPELLVADPARFVFAVEGEKDADRLASLGLVATTNPHGAGKWRPEYGDVLRGRRVVVLPDNDPVGRAHARDVVADLLGKAAEVRLLELPGLPEHGDVSDWLDAGGTRPALEELVRELPALREVPDMGAGLTDDVWPTRWLADLAGEPRVVEEKWTVHGILRRGRCHWIYSQPGAGKTIFSVGLGTHVAAGKEFCGRAVDRGPVLYVGEDMPVEELEEYLYMVTEACEVDLEHTPFGWTAEPGLRLSDPKIAARVKQTVTRYGVRTVFLDSCERLAPSENFNSHEAQGLIDLIQWLTHRGITVVVIDHTNKSLANQREKNQVVKPDMLDVLYGGRTKSAFTDMAIYCDGNIGSGSGLRLKWTKERGRPTDPLSVYFDYAEGFRLTGGRTAIRVGAEQRVMAWFNNHGGSGWYDRETLAEKCKLSVRTLERVMPAMVESGLLLVRGDVAGAGRGNRAEYARDRSGDYATGFEGP
jgi:hypothetical protein